jgi:hypothetical protein
MRALILCLFLLSFAGCSEESRLPAGVLPPEKMEVVLWDMMMANEWIDYRMQQDSTPSLQTITGHYQQALAAHKVTRDAFDKSIRFYEGRPDLLKPILDTLYQRVERKAGNPGYTGN